MHHFYLRGPNQMTYGTATLPYYSPTTPLLLLYYFSTTSLLLLYYFSTTSLLPYTTSYDMP